MQSREGRKEERKNETNKQKRVPRVHKSQCARNNHALRKREYLIPLNFFFPPRVLSLLIYIYIYIYIFEKDNYISNQ